MLCALRVQDIQGEGSHEQWSARGGDLQDSHLGLRSWIPDNRDIWLSLRKSRQFEKCPQDIHCVEIVLPNLQATRTEIDSQHAMGRRLVVHVQRYGLGNIGETPGRNK